MAKCCHAIQTVHLSRATLTLQDDGVGGLTLLSTAVQNMLLKYGQGLRGKKIQFTTGHLSHKLCNHQALTAVKAVHAHNCHDAMHQYVMTNLSLRDTIRRSQEQPLSGWRENRLTAKDRQRGIKDQLCQEDRDTALSSLQSPRSVLFISRSAQNIGKKPNCLKGANLRQQVLSCFILGSGQR